MTRGLTNRRPQSAISKRSRRTRLLTGIAAGVAAALLVPAIVVYACVGVVGLSASPTSVQPGGTFVLHGTDFVVTVPVQIHLDTINGPVIATVTQYTGTGVMSSTFAQTVTLPSTVSSGQHVLIATQSQHTMNGGNPARAVIYVGQPAPAASGPEARPAAVTIDSGPGWPVLALVALGSALVGFFVFSVVALRARTPSAGVA